jgi:hypothetical protein
MANSEDSSQLAALPLELREQIYKVVLSSPSQGPALLRTCREIRTEAHKFLFQRPIILGGQKALYRWLDESPSEFLLQVTEMSLKLQDVDLTSLLQTHSSTDEPSTPSPLSICELYEAELIRLEQALRKVANVETLSIRKLSNEPSFLYRDFVAKCLHMLSSVYPALKSLRLDGDFQHHDLSFLKCFRHLDSFSFDGFSSSSPASTADVLSELDALSNLSLTSQHGRPIPDLHIHTDTMTKRQSFTVEVVRIFNRPTPSTVTKPIAVAPLALLFAPVVLASLQYFKTLNSISILLSYTPDIVMLQSLEHMLEICLIKRLELDWPHLDPLCLEEWRLLTDSLQVFWVRTRSESDAFEILWSIFESREARDSRDLRKVVLKCCATEPIVVSTVVENRRDSTTASIESLAYDVSPLCPYNSA